MLSKRRIGFLLQERYFFDSESDMNEAKKEIAENLNYKIPKFFYVNKAHILSGQSKEEGTYLRKIAFRNEHEYSFVEGQIFNVTLDLSNTNCIEVKLNYKELMQIRENNREFIVQQICNSNFFTVRRLE